MRKEELMELNLYKILELPFNASDDQITAAFKVRGKSEKLHTCNLNYKL